MIFHYKLRDHLLRKDHRSSNSLALTYGRTAVIHNQTAASEKEEEEKDNHALCTLIALVKTRKMLLALLSLHGQIDTRVSWKKGVYRQGEGERGG